jgi:hypothetical protein
MTIEELIDILESKLNKSIFYALENNTYYLSATSPTSESNATVGVLYLMLLFDETTTSAKELIKVLTQILR